MDIDLVISQSGAVMIASNEPFVDEVSRVEYHRDNKLIILVFDNGEDKLMDVEIHEDLLNSMEDITSIFVVYMQENKPHDGFEVPFIKIGM